MRRKERDASLLPAVNRFTGGTQTARTSRCPTYMLILNSATEIALETALVDDIIVISTTL